MKLSFGKIAVASLSLALAGSGAVAAETWQLCKGDEQIEPLGSASALVLLKDGQFNLPRTSLNAGHISFHAAPNMFPSLHLGFSYDLRSTDLKALELTSLNLSFNGGGEPKVCGPGVTTIQADSREVYRGEYSATRGMCAVTVILEREASDPLSARAADAIAAATTVAVRFVSDDGLTDVGGTFQDLVPARRERGLRLALDRALGRRATTERCQSYKTSIIDALAPSQWVQIPR